MRTLVIIIAIVMAAIIIKRLINTKSRSKTSDSHSNENSGQGSKSSETLSFNDTVKCGFCGTHIPALSAYKSGDKHYCDEAHSKKGQK